MSVIPYDDYDPYEEPPDQMDGGDEDEQWDPSYGRVSTSSRPSISYVNEAGVPEDVIDRHFRRGQWGREVASIVEQWSQSLNAGQVNQTLDVFNRSRGYKNEVHPHAVMARCAWAVENDDVLSTLADVIEGLMWQKCRFELIDNDQQSFWNQWAGDVNLDSQLRKMGREEFKVSQFYIGLWWVEKVYQVDDNPIQDQLKEFEREKKRMEWEKQVEAQEQLIAVHKNDPLFVAPGEIPEPDADGPGRGNRKRKKKFPVQVPIAMTVFEPTKVIPVGMLMFGRERFAYVATRAEDEAFLKVMQGEVVDGTVLQLIERKYEPTDQDKQACADIGVDYNRLWLFKQDSCFRHADTKSDYERYAACRMKPILPILEMKDHLRASDRASLIGNTNFIVVITKGTDRLPAKPAEITNLQEQARVIARLPVLIGDHRLHVEIVSPNTDNTLIEARWQTLDSRLVFAALKTFSPVTQGGNSGGAGVSEMSMVVANGLQSRRHMIVRTLEARVFKAILDRNEGVLDEDPNLVFTPKRIVLDFNTDIVNAILKLRDRGDISRETMLEELDYDQDNEVLRRGRERVEYDPTFESGTPFSSPQVQPFGSSQPAAAGQSPLAPPPKPAPPAPRANVGPAGQPRTEGGRPKGATDKKRPRKRASERADTSDGGES